MELFFDLVYVFAITQLSHLLLYHPTVWGALQTLFLLLVVWWAWQYTTWFTNWFDPDTLPVRLTLVAVMLASLVMSVAIPEAFGERGLMFALAYVAIQVGRPPSRSSPWAHPTLSVMAFGGYSRGSRCPASCGWREAC